jgi:hypothetical protein
MDLMAEASHPLPEEQEELQGDSKLLSVFFWPIIFKSVARK